jgi:lysophospholipid acyltransferase (LPLAT)-like uncharacterized protein
LQLTRVLQEGRDLAITPDGPRGPARSVAPGALVVAQRAGAPLLPIAVSASSAWRLRSWDSFLIPKPFAKLHVAYAEPVFVNATNSRAAADETHRVSDALALAEQRANG